MKLFLSFLVSLFLSSNVLASTLGEIEAGAAIANTLQGTAQMQSQKALDQAKQVVKKYEEAQNRELASIKDIETGSVSGINSSPEKSPHPLNSPLPNSADSSPSLSKRTPDRQLGNEKMRQAVKPVDYNRKIQVFYKKECDETSQRSCHRGAVLTNIKSLAFDYAHNRGGFSKTETKKK